MPAPAVSIAEVEALLERARNIRATLGSLGDAAPSAPARSDETEATPDPAPEPEPKPAPADKAEANPHIMLLEGLSPGSKIED
jgi:hypothetical protein